MDQLNHARTGWTRFLYGLRGRIWIVYTHIFVYNIYSVFRNSYEAKYKIPKCDQPRSPCKPEAAPAADCLHWRWRDLPKMPAILNYYRVVTSIYFAYIVVRYIAQEVCYKVCVQFVMGALGLTKPVYCYAPGHFVIYDLVRKECAMFFACFHLIWRLFTIFDFRPIEITTFYFLLLDDHDILLYYRLLDQQAPAVNPAERCAGGPRSASKPHQRRANGPPPDPRLEMMHDIMSFKVEYTWGLTHRLRPNRTAGACRELREYSVQVTLVCTILFGLLAVLMTVILTIHLLDDRVYMEHYSKCDPELEQMFADGRLSRTQKTIHATKHQWVTFFFDGAENAFLWLESGMVLGSSILCTLILNRDLTVHWTHLHHKIEVLLMMIKANRAERRLARRDSSARDKLAQHQQLHEESVYELQMEICDFIKHLHRSDQLMGDVMTTVVNVWFTLFAFFIYRTILRVEENSVSVRLPVELNLTLIAVFFCTTFQSVLTISVHANCMKSYVKICSLMAVDTSRHKERFTEILDFFIRRRTCYTIYRAYPMTISTYLTIISYSFSCFFILGSVNRPV